MNTTEYLRKPLRKITELITNKLFVIIIFNFQFSIFNFVSAQRETVGSYRLADATQLWRLTDNAAGLAIDTARNRGYAQIGYDHHSGSYHRVQEAQRTNQLRFQTERYQRVGKHLYGYGRFDFDYGRMNDRAWSDVVRSYNSDPYIAGSAIVGKYDFQDFNFTAALASEQLWQHWHFGLKLDYNVGDLSRLRDPRPRSTTLEYKLTPAVTYTVGRSTFGLSGNYHRRKEKINGVTTIQSDAVITYYNMTGMEHATGTLSGYSGFRRQWVDHRFGGELTYAYNNPSSERSGSSVSPPFGGAGGGYTLLVAASIERGAEDIMGQNERQYGQYIDYKYGLSIMNRLRCGRLLHQADVRLGYDQGYADEWKQQEVTENEIINGTYRTEQYTRRLSDGTIETRDTLVLADESRTVTHNYFITQMVLRKRYQVKVFDLDLHYRLNWTGAGAISGYAGARFAMQDVSNKYLLPTSTLRYNTFDTTIEGGTGLLRGRLWIDAALTYRGVGKAELDLDDATTDYALGVLLPDMQYYRAKFIKGSLSVTYNFPVTLWKKPTSWYVRASGDWLKTNTHEHAAGFALTVGMFN